MALAIRKKIVEQTVDRLGSIPGIQAPTRGTRHQSKTSKCAAERVDSDSNDNRKKQNRKESLRCET